ncbi:hypothetical protein CsatB_018902 [Cannabis sativa]
MVNTTKFYVLFFFLTFATILVQSKIPEYDDYWKNRAEESQKYAIEAYTSNPEEVTEQLNSHVEQALTKSSNSSRRRELRGRRNRKTGPCRATNPIDRCWRCDPNWASNRKKLADCVLGFGRNTVGGKNGSYYIVTDPSDNNLVDPLPGTLRHAVTRKKPLWIIFARSMIIRLNEELIITSDKTIDARGANVMLFGASDSYSADQMMQVTVAFNHFGQGLVQRMPRCRWGFFHVVNNDYTHWLMYAIGGSQHPTIISQGNRFIAPPNLNAKEVTKREYAEGSEWKQWQWKSQGDLMMNGAFFVESGSRFNKKQFSRHDMIKYKPGTFVTRLTRNAGTLICRYGKPC